MLYSELAKQCGVKGHHVDLPLVIQMIPDFQSLMERKQKIERNGYKNEFYKANFEQTGEFEVREKYTGFWRWKQLDFKYIKQHYYNRKKTICKIQMEKEMSSNARENKGFCVLIIDSAKVANQILTNFKKA